MPPVQLKIDKETKMNHSILLNNEWKFRRGFTMEDVSGSTDSGFEMVNLPHTVQEIPYDCFDQTMTCMVSTYVKYFDLDEISGKRILLSFEGVSACYDLYLNGEKAGSHKGAYSAALFDVTEFVCKGSNRMVLMVDSNERDDIPPNGSTVDYLIYGGIYRDVKLYIREKIYVKHLLARYDMDDNAITLCPELLLENAGSEKKVHVKTQVFPKKNGEDPVLAWEQDVMVPAGSSSVMLEGMQIRREAVECWSIGNPALYSVRVQLLQENRAEDRENGSEKDSGNVLLDETEVTTGFRTVKVTPDGFYLNGEKIKLIGLNRHQSYPYVGYALGKRAQEKDAQLLKKFMGLNMVRCSHYMQSEYFLNACDELGLMVFEEIPGWGYIGGEEFQKVVFDDLKNMVLGHYNHPGIVIWGTRLNETTDDDELYERTNRICKEMDPSRPTTGVRWETGSHLLEDIYSYNDYSEDDRGDFMLLTAHQATKSPEKVPYLLSEHTGAVLPTKPGDSEERQEQFAIRHARVLSKILTMDDYLGALGWCMFDYNTHNDHNSLNKVCYHGVMDMYRVPKWAAYLYASQKSPEEEIIMEPCSMVGRGERCEPVPFYVLTNCDYIDVTLSADETRRYYPSVKFNGLKHAPIEVTENGEFWQHRWKGATIAGFVDGREVIRKIWSDNPYLAEMRAAADDEELDSGISDATRIVVYFLDENGNRLYFHQGAAAVTVSENLELIGPPLRSVLGGAVAFWVKTKADGISGTGTVTVTSDRSGLEAAKVQIRII